MSQIAVSPGPGGGLDLPSLVACHDCDLLQRRTDPPPGGKALCSRCGASLYRAPINMLDRTIAFSIASLLLLAIVLSFPFMEFKFAGRVQVNHLASGAYLLWADGFRGLAALVLLTSVAGPAALIGMLLLVCMPLRLGRRPGFIAPLCRLLGKLQPWSMMEVYLLGVIVGVVKLSQMADLVMGPASYAFFALIFTLTAAIGCFDRHTVWERLDRR
jgi:paraquat-inducible protein A